MKNYDASLAIQTNLHRDRIKREGGSGFKKPNDFFDALEKVPYNDLDAASFLHGKFSASFTYIPTSATKGDWYYWNGAIHVKDDLNQIDDYLATGLANYLRDLTKALATDHKNLNEDDRKLVDGILNAVRGYARQIRSAQALKNLKSRIRLTFTKPVDYFDNDSQWAVLADGQVIDLDNLSGTLLPADSSRPVSRALGVVYAGTVSSPKWQASLDQWVPDKAVQEYLQVAAGAALRGKGDAKNIVALVGISNTGKSTYINILKEVFGGYAGALPATAIVQKYGGASNFEQSKARGKRFLYLSEPQAQRTDDAFLKNLSGGGETIPTANKGQDSVEWKAQCVLHIASNHTPKFDTQDNAIVERMNLVGFDHVFARDKSGSADTFAKDLVASEGAGILAWILEGAKIYQDLGYIPVPDAIREKSQGNVVEASAPLRWLQEVVDDGKYRLAPGEALSDYVKPVDLYREYQEWSFESGEKAVSQKIWLREIERFNSMPAEYKGKRTQGFARVYGVVQVVQTRALSGHSRVHQPITGNHATLAEKFGELEPAL